MGQNVGGFILQIVLATLGIIMRIPLPEQRIVALVTPTPSPIVAVAPTESPQPTVTSTIAPTKPSVPSRTPTPSIIPTPTIDQKAVDICNTAFMPIIEFAGHSCLFADENYRWMDSVNGYQETQDDADTVFKSQKENEIRQMLLKQCLRSTKEQFETCSSSIRDNAGRIRDELAKKIESDVQNCIASSSKGGDVQRKFTSRFMAKDRLKGKITELYDFCFAHNNSVAEYHP